MENSVATRGGNGMTEDFFKGNLVELTPINLESDLETWSNWNRNSDYMRFLDDSPATQFSPAILKSWFEKDDSDSCLFTIRSLCDNKLIGFVELEGHDWVSRNAWVGIGIGDPDYWGKGYGSEAMNLALKFAFRVQNLHRVNLGVFSFNPRAIHCYEKCGFRYEGKERDFIYKDDQRWDAFNMGVLQSEWETLQSLT
jgi:RimJ/RimL family protein N-acetyltransferase